VLHAEGSDDLGDIGVDGTRPVIEMGRKGE
jgi:hypothetical protein